MPSKRRSGASSRRARSESRSRSPADAPPPTQVQLRRARDSSGEREDTPSKKQRRVSGSEEGVGESESDKEDDGPDLQAVVNQRMGRGHSKAPAKKRAEKTPENKWQKMGRVLGRVYMPLEPIREYFDRMMEIDRDASHTDMQVYELEIFDLIIDKFPDVNDLVEDMPTAKFAKVCADISYGRSKARAEDYLEIKRNICFMYPFKNALPSDSTEGKKLRGFNNDDCTELLAPDGLDLKDEKIRLALSNSEILVTPGEYSRMLYKGYVIHPENKITGLFLADILFKGGRYIARGRGAGLSNSTRVRSTTKSSKSQIDTITPEFIGYVAMLVHCALSDRPTFAPNNVEVFTYREYYESIVAIFRRFSVSHRKLIIDEWTKEIFGNARTSVRESLEGADPTISFPSGCLGKIIFEQAGQT